MEGWWGVVGGSKCPTTYCDSLPHARSTDTHTDTHAHTHAHKTHHNMRAGSKTPEISSDDMTTTVSATDAKSSIGLQRPPLHPQPEVIRATLLDGSPHLPHGLR